MQNKLFSSLPIFLWQKIFSDLPPETLFTFMQVNRDGRDIVKKINQRWQKQFQVNFPREYPKKLAAYHDYHYPCEQKSYLFSINWLKAFAEQIPILYPRLNPIQIKLFMALREGLFSKLDTLTISFKDFYQWDADEERAVALLATQAPNFIRNVFNKLISVDFNPIYSKEELAFFMACEGHVKNDLIASYFERYLQKISTFPEKRLLGAPPKLEYYQHFLMLAFETKKLSLIKLLEEKVTEEYFQLCFESASRKLLLYMANFSSLDIVTYIFNRIDLNVLDIEKQDILLDVAMKNRDLSVFHYIAEQFNKIPNYYTYHANHLFQCNRIDLLDRLFQELQTTQPTIAKAYFEQIILNSAHPLFLKYWLDNDAIKIPQEKYALLKQLLLNQQIFTLVFLIAKGYFDHKSDMHPIDSLQQMNLYLLREKQMSLMAFAIKYHVLDLLKILILENDKNGTLLCNSKLDLLTRVIKEQFLPGLEFLCRHQPYEQLLQEKGQLFLINCLLAYICYLLYEKRNSKELNNKIQIHLNMIEFFLKKGIDFDQKMIYDRIKDQNIQAITHIVSVLENNAQFFNAQVGGANLLYHLCYRFALKGSKNMDYQICARTETFRLLLKSVIAATSQVDIASKILEMKERTALHFLLKISSLHSQKKHVVSLLKGFENKDFDLFAKDQKGETIIELIIKQGYYECFEILIKKHVLLRGSELSCAFQPSILHLAVKYNQLVLIKRLLSYGANLSYRDKNGETPLFLLHEANLDVLKYLLDQGARFTPLNHSGLTPLFQAILENPEKSSQLTLKVKKLKAHYQDKLPLYLEIINSQGQTVLEYVTLMLEPYLRYPYDFKEYDQISNFAKAACDLMELGALTPKSLEKLIKTTNCTHKDVLAMREIYEKYAKDVNSVEGDKQGEQEDIWSLEKNRKRPGNFGLFQYEPEKKLKQAPNNDVPTNDYKRDL